MAHLIPKFLWSSGGAIEEKRTWVANSKYCHGPTKTSFRLTAGNKIYALSASVAGEFDLAKKVPSDRALFNKYRLADKKLKFLLSLSLARFVIGSNSNRDLRNLTRFSPLFLARCSRSTTTSALLAPTTEL